MKSLSEEELRSIYEKVIKPRYFNNVSSNDPDTPKVSVFLGGQSGSGKSYLNQKAINDMENRSAVTLDTDMLRSHHPHEPLLAEKDVYALDKDCFKWGDMLIEDSIKENKNLLFDGTFGGNTEEIHKKMSRLKEEGYIVKTSVLAVNDTVSKIGIQYRYESVFNKIGRGRPVDVLYHDQVYSRIPANLLTTAAKGIVDEFNIYGRDHYTKELSKVSSFTKEELAQDSEKLVVEFVKERNRTMRPDEVQSLSSWYASTIRLTEANKHDAVSFRTTVHTQDISASNALKSQIDQVMGLSKEQIKRINELRKSIDDSTKEITELQSYTGELRKQSKFLENSLLSSIKSSETKIKLISSATPEQTKPSPVKDLKKGNSQKL